jgi:hypothetical protein
MVTGMIKSQSGLMRFDQLKVSENKTPIFIHEKQ